jgi:hypothetical protein
VKAEDAGHDGLTPSDGGIPAGWRLVHRFDGDHAVVLDFQRDGRFGPRVTGFGTTYAEAMRFAEPWMERYDEQARNRRR